MTAIQRARKLARFAYSAKLRNDETANTLALDAALDAFLAKLAEDGMVVVPREPTAAMLEVGETGIPDRYYRDIWAAMIEAATSPPPPEGKGDGT